MWGYNRRGESFENYFALLNVCTHFLRTYTEIERFDFQICGIMVAIKATIEASGKLVQELQMHHGNNNS